MRKKYSVLCGTASLQQFAAVGGTTEKVPRQHQSSHSGRGTRVVSDNDDHDDHGGHDHHDIIPEHDNCNCPRHDHGTHMGPHYYSGTGFMMAQLCLCVCLCVFVYLYFCICTCVVGYYDGSYSSVIDPCGTGGHLVITA